MFIAKRKILGVTSVNANMVTKLERMLELRDFSFSGTTSTRSRSEEIARPLGNMSDFIRLSVNFKKLY